MAVMDPFTELEWRLIGGHMVPVMRLRGSAAPAAADAGGCPSPSAAPQTFGPAEWLMPTVTTAAAAQPPMTQEPEGWQMPAVPTAAAQPPQAPEVVQPPTVPMVVVQPPQAPAVVQPPMPRAPTVVVQPPTVPTAVVQPPTVPTGCWSQPAEQACAPPPSEPAARAAPTMPGSSTDDPWAGWRQLCPEDALSFGDSTIIEIMLAKSFPLIEKELTEMVSVTGGDPRVASRWQNLLPSNFGAHDQTTDLSWICLGTPQDGNFFCYSSAMQKQKAPCMRQRAASFHFCVHDLS